MKKFTFKSKYRNDKVTLRKAVMKKNPDGTASIMTPPEYAEFDRNDWSTTDAELAKDPSSVSSKQLSRSNAMGAYTQNHIANGNLELWDAGPVPADMDAQVTATTITTLDYRTMDQQSPEQNAWAAIAGREDKLVYEGFRSLRATLTAAAVADDFRLFPEGCTAALTGASLFDVKGNLAFLHRYAFTFAARCSVGGNQLRVRLYLRDNGDAPRLWANANGAWNAFALIGTAVVDFSITNRWQRYGFEMAEVPQTDGTNVIENMVWSISNATAGAQVIDLDDLQITDLDRSYSAP
jgi:hypothetical protein